LRYCAPQKLIWNVYQSDARAWSPGVRCRCGWGCRFNGYHVIDALQSCTGGSAYTLGVRTYAIASFLKKVIGFWNTNNIAQAWLCQCGSTTQRRLYIFLLIFFQAFLGAITGDILLATRRTKFRRKLSQGLAQTLASMHRLHEVQYCSLQVELFLAFARLLNCWYFHSWLLLII